ncbi:MAG: alkaline phosphatase D family protein [Chitinophagales bacterium]|nr:alkaline phosphatase D family protein [Chitinophagales bacterium]
MKSLVSILFLSLSISTLAKNPKLLAGPMQGHTTHNSTAVWILVQHTQLAIVTVKDVNTGSILTIEKLASESKTINGKTPFTFQFYGLQPEHVYKVSIILDSQVVSADRVIKTFSNEPGRNWSFSVGSCAFIPPHGLRWIQPGIEERTFKYMTAIPSDFMVWTGDYLYFLGKDHKSYKGMFNKYVETRTRKKMEAFVESRPQYAIWDDHEFGPNNACGDFSGKNDALDVWTKFWPSPAYGTDSLKGIFYSFKHLDGEFFMTDGRFYRTEPDEKTPLMFGDKQMKWLENKLLASTATFKFIAIGSQVLNKMNKKDCFQHFKSEEEELLKFIADNKITGVIFLTGDMHYSEIIKLDRPGAYPLYDFTCSGITSFPFKVTRSEQKNNPQRVPGMVYDSQNNGRISISGPVGNRQCTMEVFDKRGKLKFSYNVSEKDLQYPGAPSMMQPVKNN